MINRILTIAFKELYSLFSDPVRVAFILLTPLAIATIIGLAFGGQSGNLTITDIPVAVVNLDEGVSGVGGSTNYGQIVAGILLSESGDESDSTLTDCPLTDADSQAAEQSPQTLDDLFNAVRLADADAARQAVDDGQYAAAIIIPAGFTDVLQPETRPPSLADLFGGGVDDDTPDQVTVEVYGSGARPVSAQVARSVTESIVSQIVTGGTAIRVTVDTLAENPQSLLALSAGSEEDFAAFGCAFDPALSTIQLDRVPLDDIQVETPFVQIVVAFGAAQAMFFSLFTATGAVQTVYQERKIWVLQRLIMSPNPRWIVLAGKLSGMLLIVIVQVGLLMIALNVIAILVTGQTILIWGSNVGLMLLMLLAIAIAVSGVSVFVTGIARSEQQASIFASLASIGLAVLGGAFGFSMPESIAQFSIIHWGMQGFLTLSAGSTDIALNVLILMVQGALLFVVGAWLFSRQLEV